MHRQLLDPDHGVVLRIHLYATSRYPTPPGRVHAPGTGQLVELVGNRHPPIVDEVLRWPRLALAPPVRRDDRRELVDVREQVGHRPIGTGGGVVELVVTYAGYLSAHLVRRRAEVEHGESRSGGPFTENRP